MIMDVCLFRCQWLVNRDLTIEEFGNQNPKVDQRAGQEKESGCVRQREVSHGIIPI